MRASPLATRQHLSADQQPPSGRGIPLLGLVRVERDGAFLSLLFVEPGHPCGQEGYRQRRVVLLYRLLRIWEHLGIESVACGHSCALGDVWLELPLPTAVALTACWRLDDNDDR